MTTPRCHPDHPPDTASTATADQQSYVYNALGEVVNTTDRNGTEPGKGVNPEKGS